MNKINTLQTLSEYLDYSLLNNLNCDPDSKKDGHEYLPREVFSGHYVPVIPTAIKNPKYISHSKKFFDELNFEQNLARNEDFMALFSGNTSNLPNAFNKYGWATGYALSIYGTEYYQQCPFQTGNGYGDGRAISIIEVLIDGKRWEMQLKGGGRTPYCRGADGRAVLRSSIREFLAQEHMNALNIPSSRSLTLYTSDEETVSRPWFNEKSFSRDPEVMIEETVAISTRVAPSFLRVGQLELFARRSKKNEHPNAKEELKKIVLHAIQREYKDEIDNDLDFEDKVLSLAKSFKTRLISLVSNWIRVGFCQGNFNADNCSVGGFTLDFGPFGFMDDFDPQYQSWTGGGIHFSFFNQGEAARQNFKMFCKSLEPLLNPSNLTQLEEIKKDFKSDFKKEIHTMWTNKLGLEKYCEDLIEELFELMMQTKVDYTIFFRELSSIPSELSNLEKSFFNDINKNEEIKNKWITWFSKWKNNINTSISSKELSNKMKLVNPKYTLKEWFLVPAYKAAQNGDYSLIHELQEVMNSPYNEQSKIIEDKYYKKKPKKFFNIAGVSFVSCSS